MYPDSLKRKAATIQIRNGELGKFRNFVRIGALPTYLKTSLGTLRTNPIMNNLYHKTTFNSPFNALV